MGTLTIRRMYLRNRFNGDEHGVHVRFYGFDCRGTLVAELDRFGKIGTHNQAGNYTIDFGTGASEVRAEPQQEFTTLEWDWRE